MAHVGSPDTFFAGKAGPYRRARQRAAARRDSGTRAGGGARRRRNDRARRPARDACAPVSGTSASTARRRRNRPRRSLAIPTLYSRRAVVHDADVVSDCPSTSTDRRERAPRSCRCSRSRPQQRPMPPWLGGVLAALGVFLSRRAADDCRQRGARERAAAWRRARRRGAGTRAHRRWRSPRVLVAVDRSGAATAGGRRKRPATAGRCCTVRSSRGAAVRD